MFSSRPVVVVVVVAVVVVEGGEATEISLSMPGLRLLRGSALLGRRGGKGFQGPGRKGGGNVWARYLDGRMDWIGFGDEVGRQAGRQDRQ
ncbi:hypothetical protein KC361_g143 [Hortaea werneckii]|nr:hypothetical protein KC361_g143 [Hortaea werneckii]